MPNTPSTAKRDPRHPDTDADKLEPATYGFRTIDTTGADDARAAGPGVLEAQRVESTTGPDNSTFASRAAARRGEGKVVEASAGVELK